MYYDDTFRHVGEFGRYQKFLYFLICLPQIFSGIQTFLPVFILHVPDHRCASPMESQMSFALNDPNAFTNNNYTILSGEDNNKITTYFQCDILHEEIDVNNTSDDIENATTYKKEKCNTWIYDKTYFDFTFAMQSDLVCEKKADRTHAVMSFMAGLTGGSLVTGFISDLRVGDDLLFTAFWSSCYCIFDTFFVSNSITINKISAFIKYAIFALIPYILFYSYGRKKAFMMCICLLIFPNIGLTFVTDYMVFVVLRCVSGFAVGGLLGTGFVLGMEIVGPTKRSWAGLVFEFFWAAGAMILALAAYLIRDWRHLNLVMSVPPVLFLSYIWLVPESPRWLLIKGKIQEAEAILEKTARLNKRFLPSDTLEKISFASKHRGLPLWKACTHPIIMYQLTVILFGWMIVSMVFYGLAMNSGNIGGNLYLNFFMSSFAELIGFAGCLAALHKMGRRPVFAISVLISGAACLLTIFPVLYASTEYQWTAMVLSTLGKVNVSAAFAVMFLYSGEIFPTVIRNSALGIAAFFARVGGMIAPYIIDIAAYIEHDIGKATPLLIFGVTAIVAGIFALKLPETKGVALPETIEDWMNFGKSGLADIEIEVSCEKLNKEEVTKSKEGNLKKKNITNYNEILLLS
ncbi:organic cation transporter protein-like [Mytilus trossulus]|uniref:organic cation transporter protein-like n=1 Tax=Mytilus trossulus TaxID=6551 RepID=UPI003006270F